LLEEVVEPAGAGHVAQHAIHRAALHDRHPGLRDGPRSGQGDPAAAGEVQDVDAAGGAFLADLDEVFLRALEPGGFMEHADLVIEWRFMRDPRSYFRHLSDEL
jgi:hypothetical protein